MEEGGAEGHTWVGDGPGVGSRLRWSMVEGRPAPRSWTRPTTTVSPDRRGSSCPVQHQTQTGASLPRAPPPQRPGPRGTLALRDHSLGVASGGTCLPRPLQPQSGGASVGPSGRPHPPSLHSYRGLGSPPSRSKEKVPRDLHQPRPPSRGCDCTAPRCGVPTVSDGLRFQACVGPREGPGPPWSPGILPGSRPRHLTAAPASQSVSQGGSAHGGSWSSLRSMCSPGPGPAPAPHIPAAAVGSRGPFWGGEPVLDRPTGSCGLPPSASQASVSRSRTLTCVLWFSWWQRTGGRAPAPGAASARVAPPSLRTTHRVSGAPSSCLQALGGRSTCSHLRDLARVGARLEKAPCQLGATPPKAHASRVPPPRPLAPLSSQPPPRGASPLQGRWPRASHR